MSDRQQSSTEPGRTDRDWSGFLGTLMSISVLVSVAAGMVISVGFGGAVGTLFLAVWGAYFLHPGVEVAERA